MAGGATAILFQYWPQEAAIPLNEEDEADWEEETEP